VTAFLSGIARWLAGKAVALLVILAVLLAAAWVNGELKRAEELRRDRAQLVAQMDALARQAEELKRAVAGRSRRSESIVRNIGASLQRAREERQRLRDENYWARKYPFSDTAEKIRLLDVEIAVYQEVVSKETQIRELAARELAMLVKSKEEEAGRLGAQVAGIDGALGKSYVARLQAVARQELPTALGILAGLILLPVVLKVFLYYAVAPWATRRPPLRLLPEAAGRVFSPYARESGQEGAGRMSAVSQPVVLGEDQELLVKPEYLQSTALRATKQTRWLLDARIPFTSLFAGMYMLTRVGPAGAEPVVISATRDPLSEVGIVELSEDAAFVCQPSSLAGLIQDRGRPVRITRHWRLGSLQSWLTMQLRFLVFHGPGRLVLHGCRGIRIEAVGAGAGRLINQAATLGFSANLGYANTRCETFVSYWSGKEDLFNDLFTGDAGVYVYEEMPDAKRATGITGRGLEGFTDAVLKVFGV
jgi:hypothetical protein